jgi:hypothetical protein
MPHENKMQFLGRATGAVEKNQHQPRMLATSRSLLLPIHLLSSSTTVSVPLLYWLFCRKIEDPLHSSSLQHLQTTSAHNCSSIPHHNSVPPLPCVISLHVHSVVAAIHSFLYNISHTQREISHAFPCSSNGETATTKKKWLIKQT